MHSDLQTFKFVLIISIFSALLLSLTYTTLKNRQEVNIDTKRNQLITAIETELESDITRGGNALDTEVISVETDEGTLFPIGGIRMTIRCTYEFQAGTP